MKVLFRAMVKNVDKLSKSKIESLIEVDDRYYAIGYESFDDEGNYYITQEDGKVYWCKYETRSIHFDKKDKKDKPIFFSISEEAKGGDIVEYQGMKYVAFFSKMQERCKFICIDGNSMLNTASLEASVEVIGIYKG